MLSGKRTIQNFGSPQILFLPDAESSHPNLELRVAFMSYYLN